ncbi:hypothetical protein D9758_006941 [Tetrapyrgos nigripes]|uniref:DUF6534 domain-containing protein n=1 Tax=Tetrapyrgos nigripes TaxID=182062 RepID=A0A8H5GSK1_9AGAR|nr:hypothetical protein D9758_006941 [Tetrapyrgos nigripes]
MSVDSTDGAQFIGFTVSTVLYGIGCLQMFIYTTHTRTRRDKLWLKLLSVSIFENAKGKERKHTHLRSNGGRDDIDTRGEEKTTLEHQFEDYEGRTMSEGSEDLFVVFCWRIWSLSDLFIRKAWKIAIVVLLILLIILDFVSTIILGMEARRALSYTPRYVTAVKIAAGSDLAFDGIYTIIIIASLLRSRAVSKRTRDAVNTLILFTVNTNLLTTLATLGEVITIVTLPSTLLSTAIGILVPRLYWNSFLATLNSREYIRNKFNRDPTTQNLVSFPQATFQGTENTDVEGVTFVQVTRSADQTVNNETSSG